MPGVNNSNPLRQKVTPVSHSSHPIHANDNGLTASMLTAVPQPNEGMLMSGENACLDEEF